MINVGAQNEYFQTNYCDLAENRIGITKYQYYLFKLTGTHLFLNTIRTLNILKTPVVATQLFSPAAVNLCNRSVLKAL